MSWLDKYLQFNHVHACTEMSPFRARVFVLLENVITEDACFVQIETFASKSTMLTSNAHLWNCLDPQFTNYEEK